MPTGEITTTLETPRLVLRPFTAWDIDDLHAMDGDARVMRYLASGLPARSREECMRVLEHIVRGYARTPQYGMLHGRRRDDDTFVGACGVFPMADGDEIELAYRVPVARWGHGYATEMAGAVLAHALRTLDVPRIVAVTWPENIASKRVLEKIGMTACGNALHYGRKVCVYVAERGRA